MDNVHAFHAVQTVSSQPAAASRSYSISHMPSALRWTAGTLTGEKLVTLGRSLGPQALPSRECLFYYLSIPQKDLQSGIFFACRLNVGPIQELVVVKRHLLYRISTMPDGSTVDITSVVLLATDIDWIPRVGIRAGILVVSTKNFAAFTARLRVIVIPARGQLVLRNRNWKS